ncbi:MAG: T9SS type A sorting domain-containing protein [Salinivirgaceae bacterium]|nr:T9SS type A sorting domain-containing protein [Salinivirgaceae bacterium]
MRRKFYSLLLLLAASTGAMADNVPGITVEYIATNTPNYVQAINSIGSLKFANGKSILVFADNTTQELGALTDLKQIKFGAVDESSTTPTQPNGIAESQVNITIYPNPTANSIKVDGIAEGQTIRLFGANGQMVLTTIETTIDMSQLPAGNYLLQTGVNVIKVVKK